MFAEKIQSQKTDQKKLKYCSDVLFKDNKLLFIAGY